MLITQEDRIFNVVIQEKGLSKKEVLSKNRTLEAIGARALFTALAHLSKVSNSNIGLMLNQNHATVNHTLKSVSENKFGLNKIYLDRIMVKYGLLESTTSETSDKIIIKLGGKYAHVYEQFDCKCFVCGYDEVVEVHHIVPRREGGTDDITNLVLLCPNHRALAKEGQLFVNRSFKYRLR